MQPDGKILAQGTSTVSNDDSFVLARYQIAELGTGNFQSDSFKVYPNPFSESITIDNKDLNLMNATAELYDISGRKLSEYKLDGTSNSIQMDKNLSKGTYLLKLTSEGKSETVKITKQ